MQSDSELYVCKICSISDTECLTKLGIAICTSCWDDTSTNRRYFNKAEIDKINDKIFLGNSEAHKRKSILKALGVTHILTVGDELDILHPTEFNYKKIKVDDFAMENISKHFEETYDFIEEAQGKIYVHCAAGVSRSSTIVIAYLMKKEGKLYEEALEYVKERRAVVKPNGGFVKQLRRFENTIKDGNGDIE